MVLLLFDQGDAWGAAGHRIVAALAERFACRVPVSLLMPRPRNVSGSVMDQVRRLLPDDDVSLPDIANWADEVLALIMAAHSPKLTALMKLAAFISKFCFSFPVFFLQAFYGFVYLIYSCNVSL